MSGAATAAVDFFFTLVSRFSFFRSTEVKILFNRGCSNCNCPLGKRVVFQDLLCCVTHSHVSYIFDQGCHCEAIIKVPVSDWEYRATLPETASMIDLASTMIGEGGGMDLMPREADLEAPMTAYRYHSLCAYMGDDDVFSSDLSDDQLRTRLGHMSSTPCQAIFSMADEYVPEYVDKKALVERLCRALGGAEKVEIEWGNHSLSNRVEEEVKVIVNFIKTEGPKGWDDPWS